MIPEQFKLKVDELYTYNFPGCPSQYGVFLGFVELGEPMQWIAMLWEDEIKFVNTRDVPVFRPESDPRI